jgi:hypothetical protein
MRRIITPALWILMIIALAGFGPACKKTNQEAIDPASVDEAALEEAEPEAAPKPGPPKMTEDVYIDLTVQSVLIRERNKDDEAAAEKEVEALFEKAGVTMTEFKEYEQNLLPEKMNELLRKIQEKLQEFIK